MMCLQVARFGVDCRPLGSTIKKMGSPEKQVQSMAGIDAINTWNTCGDAHRPL
jgi:hypothetical protein